MLVEHVVEGVVQPAEVVRRPAVAPLGRVVEDNVEEDLEPPAWKASTISQNSSQGADRSGLKAYAALGAPKAIGL